MGLLGHTQRKRLLPREVDDCCTQSRRWLAAGPEVWVLSGQMGSGSCPGKWSACRARKGSSEIDDDQRAEQETACSGYWSVGLLFACRARKGSSKIDDDDG